MYEQVFNFNSRPFTSTPYVKHYFPASAMNQAFGQASICIERGSGPVVAIGDIGTGKSLLLAKLESEYQTKLQVVNLVCSGVNSRREFLQNILFQIGKPFNMDSETELRFAVIESAQPTSAFPDGLLLLVDDAETLSADVFDEMRALSNIVVDGSPQVRLVLAGRKSLEELLADPALASFSQRIASRVFLNNLTRDETAAYVVEHVNRVGGDGQAMFPTETAAKLHELTDGCPRLINQVCDFSLILAGTRGTATVSAPLIEEAWNDVQSLPMGSGSGLSSAAAKSTEATEESEWTLIEFGQLDDDSPDPQDATVYDFGNSESVEESIEGYSPEEEPIEEFQQQEPIVPQPVKSNIDTELGIDLGSLQAMQDAAAARVPTDATNSTEETPADEPSTDTDEEVAADDAARIAMEQQLAAVFGTSLPSSTPELESNEVSADDEDPVQALASAPVEELAPSASMPEVSSVSEATSVPDQTNSIVGNAAGAAIAASAFAAAAHSFTPVTPQEEDGFKPATSALNDRDSNVPEPNGLPTTPIQPSPPASETQSGYSFTPAFPIDDTADFVPATQPIESAQTDFETVANSPVKEQVADDVVGQDALQPIEVSDEATASPALPSASNDPFGESFAVEADVPVRPTSDIIEQNQNALKISSSDLAHVQPLHAPTLDEIIHPTTNETAEAEADETNENAPVGVNGFTTPSAEADVATTGETTNEAAADQPTAALESSTGLPVESLLAAPEEVVSDDGEQRAANPARGFSIMPMAERSGQPPTPPQPVEQTDVDLTTEHPTVPAQASIEPETSVASPASSDKTHNHDNNSVSEEISRQADEILARLHSANKPAEIDQEEQILSDIQSQQREVADSQLLGELQTSLPIPTEEPHQDDSEMLVVNPEDDSTAKAHEPESFPMTDSPISSGRASRMDYEQLFDRLRNLPEGDQK